MLKRNYKNKAMRVEVDKQSGFCFGVVNAISQAEEELTSEEPLYCLGDIVHNSEEVERLRAMGLVTIDRESLHLYKAKKVLLRAHGEPPSTYQTILKHNIKLIDASCPVVLKLQSKVRAGWERMKEVGGQVVIFGKKGHAEVVGLLGQTGGEAIVLETQAELNRIDFSKPIELFAQTTMSSDEYSALANEIKRRINDSKPAHPNYLKLHNSICGQVANRKKELIKFAQKHDVIVFVSGINSSNGKMLFEVCKGINPKTYFATTVGELDCQWFESENSVGVCGATSTPQWLMDKVADEIRGMC